MSGNNHFLQEVFSEIDGKASFSRSATFLLLVFALIWVTHLVFHNHALPDFGGLAMLIGTLYGINTIGRVVAEQLPKPTPPPPQP